MAASSKPKRNQVFLNFRGTDVRNNFLSHLYIAFAHNGIHSFVDSEELRKGEEISPALMRAIEESHVAIIIFSEEYASSPWCLEELVKIMECKEQKGLKVLPVFYKVEPREVKVGRKSYGRNMAKHELKFGKDSEKVKRWKKTLFDAGNLSSWDMNNRDEAELIQCIINELSFHLNRRPLYVTKYPVEIDSQVQKLIQLIQQESADDGVLMIGLWGPGGIGKTTIAKALYNAMERKFQGCSFLEQVREKSNRSDGLVALQRDLLYEILVHKSLMIYSVGGGISLIRERLCCKKILLVLDDVDQMNQLNALAGEGNWFGKGSRIIVTSRDKHLLTSHRMNCVYEIKPLEYDKARELFHQHAFPNSRKVGIRRDLIDRALRYANGLPLALEVLGSFLYGREESAWDSTLHKLSKSPDQTINRVLKTSFDGLGGSEREIFLDIACFFKGKRIEYIKEVLESCDFDPIIGIEILIERSLIKNVNGTLQMHDLVQLMGKDIVKQECPDDPRKRSRLWLFEEVQDILREYTRKNAIKAIVLDLPTPEEMTISPNAFTNMKRLRMFIMPQVHIFSRGPICLPNELSWLEWANYSDLEFGPGQKKLVRLYVKNGHIKQLGGNFQNFINLKSIEFCDCKFLAIVPDLSSAPNLERLYLLRCESLVEIHQSAGYLDKLKLLSISSCSNLRIFPNTLKTKSLQNLDLSYCYKLEKCPDIPEKMEHLQHLDLQWTAIKELPTSIENLVSVETINLGYCENLTRLPSSIHKLKNLKALYLYNCSNLAMFPKNLEDPIDPDGDLGFPSLSWLDLCDCNLLEVEFLESASTCPALTHLDLSNNKFTHLPTCINKYDYWKDLFVYSCKESKGISVADVSPLKVVEILVNGREMPEWILQFKEDSISFMIPPDLRGNFLGLALCVILGQNKKRTFENLFEVRIFVNGKREYFRLTFISPLESDHVKLVYIPSDNKRGEEKLLQNNWSHIQVCFGAPEGSIKKRGFRLICEQREDDLRVCFPTPSADGNKLEFQGKILEDNSQSVKKIIQWD
ncbi:hypothetical protein EUGRSUZ_E03292 [Eucalyptus grandis]|uniref:TIR domain-containing protein n=2 Tax=Eucalyptus grandis TaxID=71139 RepID=A0A059C9G9_EUCGR|nr:hypothetical protein EUGRSUZ_E03292 [Eucalyptus grandis]